MTALNRPIYHVLGQSNYALAIILDTLYQLHGTAVSVSVYSNISPEENDSLAYPYQIPGIEIREHSHSAFRKQPGARLVLGSVGKGKGVIYRFFREHYDVQSRDYESIFHPSSNLPQQATLGSGLNIGPGVTVAPFAELEDLVVVSRNASIGHHTRIGPLSTLNPGVTVAGVCDIGKEVIIGAGATVVDSIKVGDGAVIGAGSLVTKNIPPGVTAYGVPAKVIRSKTG